MVNQHFTVSSLKYQNIRAAVPKTWAPERRDGQPYMPYTSSYPFGQYNYVSSCSEYKHKQHFIVVEIQKSE